MLDLERLCRIAGTYGGRLLRVDSLENIDIRFPDVYSASLFAHTLTEESPDEVPPMLSDCFLLAGSTITNLSQAVVLTMRINRKYNYYWDVNL